MTETRPVGRHRKHPRSLLIQAARAGHMIMRRHRYASFAAAGPLPGLATAAQAAARIAARLAERVPAQLRTGRPG